MNNLTKQIRIGSRASRLAQMQVDEILSLLREKGVSLEVQAKLYQTGGDKDKTSSLTEHINDNFFTDTLDAALLGGDVDATVHSAKDLPENIDPRIKIAALTRSLDETDSLVGPYRLSELKPGSRVGTSSVLRQSEMAVRYPQLQAVSIRGNIEERIEQLKAGKYDAIIVATCALKRLGLEREIKEILPWQTTPGQGQLAVLVREEDDELSKLFAPVDNRREESDRKLKTCLYCGTNPDKYQALGRIIHFPMIEIHQVDLDEASRKKFMHCVQDYHMILFTSRHAARFFLEFLGIQGFNIRLLRNLRLCAVGRETAGELLSYGFRADITAGKESGAGLLEELKKRVELKGKKILFPRSSLPNPLLRVELEQCGACVDEVAVYTNIKPDKRPLPQEAVDKVIFTSPSTFNNFIEDYGQVPAGWQIICKGEKTQQSVLAAGYKSEVLGGGAQ